MNVHLSRINYNENNDREKEPQNKEKWNGMAEDMISRKFYRWEAE